MSENNELPQENKNEAITNNDNIEKSWFVVHTYSGYEHKVKANLESRTQTMGMSEQIFPNFSARTRSDNYSRW